MHGTVPKLGTDGFALPLTLFLVTILTVMLASAFTRAATDHQISGSTEAAVDAFGVAQSGLQAYFSMDLSTRPTTGDSVRINVPGGYAWVVPYVFQTPVDTMQDHRYVIRSSGYVINANQGSTPIARRTVAQFADWQQPWLDALEAAIIGINDVHVKSGSVTISGVDLNSCAATPHSTVMGMRIPAQNDDYSSGVISGIPAVAESGTQSYVAGLINMDWASINVLDFDYDYNSVQNGDNNYTTQVIQYDYTPGSAITGTGLLIVTGVLTLPYDFIWNGIVLVGGNVNATGSRFEVYGALIMGLDIGIGETELHTDLDNLQDLYPYVVQFDACNIRAALASVTGFVPLEHTFVDNWATY